MFQNEISNLLVYTDLILKQQQKLTQIHLMYFDMNFLWNSERSVSLINRSFLPSSSWPLAQFLKTTSSSHLNRKSVFFPISKFNSTI